MIVYFLTISVVSLYVVGKFSFQKASEALLQRTFDQLISVRVEKKNRLMDFFKQRDQDFNILFSSTVSSRILKSISNHDFASDNDSVCLLDHDSEVFLNGFIKGNSNLKSVIFIDGRGRCFVFDGDNFFLDRKIPVNLVEELGKPGNHEYITKTGVYQLFMSKMIGSGNQKLVVAIELDDFIDDILLEKNSYNGLGKSGEVYVVGIDKLMRSSSRFIENSRLRVNVNTFASKATFEGKTGVEIIEDYRGINVLSSFSPVGIPGLNWVIMAEIDESEAMIPIVDLENSIVFLSIIVSLMLLGLVAALANFLLSPLRILKNQADLIYQGQYGVEVDLNLDNEIGDLIMAFNKMSVKLKEQEERLELEKIMRLTSLIDGQELERSRLSRELHDGIAQQILALRFEIEKIDTENFRFKKDSIRDAIVNIISEIRNVSNDLMPSVLVNYGLKKSLFELQSKVEDGGMLKFNLEIEIDEFSLPKKTGLYVYRIIQETLNNTIKHGGATAYNLNIKVFGEMINIKIFDDGVGFNKDEYSEGNGLKNIHFRVNILGGSMELNSGLGKGVSYNILIPL